MSAKLGKAHKVALIASAVCLCACVWVALAGVVVLGETGKLARITQWLGHPARPSMEIGIAQPLPALTATPAVSATVPLAAITPLVGATWGPPETASAVPTGRPTRVPVTETATRGIAPTVTISPTTPSRATSIPTPAPASSPAHTATRSTAAGGTLAVGSAPTATRPTTPEPSPTSTATLRPSPTATNTPEPTQTPSPTSSPTPTVSPAPTRDTFNIILLGSDRNVPGKGTWRTDVMALTVIDRATHEVGVLAIPRDLYVSIPGHPPERLNTVDFLGHYTKYPGDGQALLDDTLRQNFGFGFDRFIRVDFAGFVELVDILGGIDVMVDCAFEELFADPELPGGRLLKVSPGLQHMDGQTALLYVRIRHGTTDTDRSRRQFKVLMAILDKALQLNTILLLPQLWNNYHTTIQTDLSLIEALDLARVAYEFKPEDMHGRVIDQTMTTPGRTTEKAWIMLPDHRRIREAYAGLLDAPNLMDAGRRVGRCPGVTATVQ